VLAHQQQSFDVHHTIIEREAKRGFSLILRKHTNSSCTKQKAKKYNYQITKHNESSDRKKQEMKNLIKY
jgi:hypothetical protein